MWMRGLLLFLWMPLLQRMIFCNWLEVRAHNCDKSPDSCNGGNAKGEKRVCGDCGCGLVNDDFALVSGHF